MFQKIYGEEQKSFEKGSVFCKLPSLFRNVKSLLSVSFNQLSHVVYLSLYYKGLAIGTSITCLTYLRLPRGWISAIVSTGE